MKLSKFIVATALAGLGYSNAQASFLSYDVFGSVPLQTTNWSTGVPVDKFDGTLGTLVSVSYEVSASVFGRARGESLDDSPATVTLSLQANVSLTPPAAGPVATAIPAAVHILNATAFDGLADFGGTSGVDISGLVGSDTDSASSALAALLLAVTDPNGITGGLDTVNWTAAALGSSIGTGAGNLSTIFNTQADADIKVTYFYNTPDVPEASTWVALTPVVAFGVWTVRRRMRAAK